MNKKTWMIVGGIVAVVLIILLWWVSVYNSLIKMNEEVDGKWAQVETQYQRRIDLIPNLVSTVKGSANFESSTLEEITALRSQWQSSTSINDKINTATQMEGALARLMVVVENYPQLRSTENFMALQDELANTENKISVERGRYNDAVRAFNARIMTIPTKIVAGSMGYSEREYFESQTGAQNAPQVSFE
jgi:LemA protein